MCSLPLFKRVIGFGNITKMVIFAIECFELTNINKPMIMTERDFADKVKRKIAGWYDKEEHKKKAIDRIVRQREVIISLLEKVRLCDITKLLEYLDRSGFYYRPSSLNGHHNFPGGLAEHSLGVYYIMKEWNALTPNERRKSILYRKHIEGESVACDILNEKMDDDEMLITAICHDLCKAERFYLNGRRIKMHSSEVSSHHSKLSVKRLKENNIYNPEINQAVRAHMRLFPHKQDAKLTPWQIESRKSILAIAVWAADKLDASRHPAGRRHRDS